MPIRDYAKKISPYNLTDPLERSGTNWNGGGSVPDLGLNGGRFTQYPSQAGYFFVFNTTKAVQPHTPPSIGGWNNNISKDLWTPSSDETCPTAYALSPGLGTAIFRRPNDAVSFTNNYTDPPVSTSEIRQSLWLNPPSGVNSSATNSIWGNYADGYFDRRWNQTAQGAGTVGPAVTPALAKVAYFGRLFYNPETYASIFFPAAGFREDMNGTLTQAGTAGFYRTTSSYGTSLSWSLQCESSTANMFWDHPANKDYTKTMGQMIRCVVQ
jgi:hypothetical protein